MVSIGNGAKMIDWIELVFYCSCVMIFFAYFGYPLSLFFLLLGRRKATVTEPARPSVSFIITAYNEEERIAQKLHNTLQLIYPEGALQIVVASDGSTDKTNSIVREFADQGVHLLALETRGGKENAQQRAVAMASGEVLVFSDVATILDPGGLKQIVSHFGDDSIGCVSSEDRVLDKEGHVCGEGVYVRYEMWLRRLESRLNSLVGLSGSFFAARKEVCQDFSADMQSDFRTLLNCVRLGYRGICDPLARGYYMSIDDEKKEFERKVRTVLRGLTVFFNNLDLLNILKYGLFSYQYVAHKLLRWLVPLFMVLAFVTNSTLALGGSLFWLVLLAGQLCFYLLAGLGVMSLRLRKNVVVKIPLFFTMANLAILCAWGRYLRGDRLVMWAPSRR